MWIPPMYAVVWGLTEVWLRGGWGKLADGVKWPPPPVRHLTKVNEMAVVSGHLSSLEVTRSKISKSCPL